jgi:hypothetical protein
MIQDSKKWYKGLSLLAGLMQFVPTSIDEDNVDQFHDIVRLLEEASDEEFSEFKIPAEKLATRSMNLAPGPYGGFGEGFPTQSKKKFCDRKYFYSRVSGLSNYITTIHGKSPAKTATPKEKLEAPTAPTHSTVINMHSSNLNFQSPGASNTQTIDFKSDDFRKLIESVKQFASTEQLPVENRQQINTDIATVEVQIGSSRPSLSIIRECLGSMKNIVEDAAGSLLASGILLHFQKYLQ